MTTTPKNARTTKGVIDTVWTEHEPLRHTRMTRVIRHRSDRHQHIEARFYAGVLPDRRNPERSAEVEILLTPAGHPITTSDPDELRRMAIVINEAARWLDLAEKAAS